MLDKNYIQIKNEFDHIKSVIENFPTGETLGFLLVGPPGCGKTLFGISMAKSFDAPYEIIDGSPQMDRRDIEGCWELQNGETIFNYGPLVRAFLNANKDGLAFVVFNEPNAVRPSEQISLNAALSESHVNLLSKAGERVQLEPDSKLVVIGTMNTNVLGIHNLQEAFDDRFYHEKVFVYPDSRKETEIIQEVSGCTYGFAAVLVEAAQELRKAAIDDKILTKTFSTRLSVNFAKIVLGMRSEYLKENINDMIVNKLSTDPKERRFVKDLLRGKDFTFKLQQCLKDEDED